jgi:hypothetical protein
MSRIDRIHRFRERKRAGVTQLPGFDLEPLSS